MTRASLVTFGAGTVFGAVLTWSLADAPEPTPAARPEIESHSPASRTSTPRDPQLDPQVKCPAVEEGSAALAREREEVAAQKRELDRRLDGLGKDLNQDHGKQLAELESCIAALKEASAKPKPRGLDPQRPGDQSFDTESLARIGFAPDEIQWIQERWEQATMEKLRLKDRLSRGDPIRKDENMAEIQGALRQDLGDEGYDAMLFATNQGNRVVLSNVLNNSPAHDAGLRDGRVIYSYDGQRVFKPMELEVMTREGRPGQLVEIELLSDGGTERYFVERGPLGATLSSTSSRPASR